MEKSTATPPVAAPVAAPGDAVGVGADHAPPPEHARHALSHHHAASTDVSSPAAPVYWVLRAVFPGLFVISLILNCVYITRFIHMAKEDYYSMTSSHFISVVVLAIVSIAVLFMPGLNLILSAVLAGMVAKDWNVYSSKQ